MFPSDVDLSNVTYTSTEQATNTLDLTTLGKSLAFDYDTNTFVIVAGTNKIPTKIDSIKQWIELFIRTEKDRYKIYTDEFGCDFSDLVGWRLPRGYQVSEIMRRINDGILSKCPCVASVTDWEFNAGTFSFTVTTDTGEEVRISE